MFCPHCGTQLNDNANFCPGCGNAVSDSAQQATQQNYQQNYQQPMPQPEPVYHAQDDADAMTDGQKLAFIKIMAIISYISIYFLLPLFLCKKMPYVRSHVNNGLVLTIFAIGVGTLGWIPFAGWLLSAAYFVFMTVVSIIGIIQAVKGNSYKLPILGGIKIIK